LTPPPWSILYLPAILDNGAPLWPEKYDQKKLDAMRAQMGSALFNCMFMGQPEGLAGEVFRASWFKLAALRVNPDLAVEVFTDSVKDGERQTTLVTLRVSDLLIYQGYDLAISAKEKADYTVCVTLGLDTATMNLYVLDVYRGHWTFAQTQQVMARQADFWKPHVIGIESTAYQAAAVQEARNHLPYPIVEVRADRDKVTRSRLTAAYAEQGSLYVCKASWTDQFIAELSTFPNGAHDDMVDALSICCNLARLYTPSGFLLWG
jgi:predicted phage terminase large subunit-like protein